MKPSLLLLAKADDAHAQLAEVHCREYFGDIETVRLQRGQSPDPATLERRGDVLLSYLCPWVVPPGLLSRFELALNFHPGPPEYPGIGCTNFALYDNRDRFGVTCHHMASRVDSGAIVGVRRFPLHPQDTVKSLTERCYTNLYELFLEQLPAIAGRCPLPSSAERWTREPLRRQQLDALCQITEDMDDQEVRRRVRATVFPGAPGPYIRRAGMRFAYAPAVTPVTPVTPR